MATRPHIVPAIPESGRAAAAALFWQAFSGKLGTLMGPEDKALRFLERVLDPSHGIAALDAQGEVIGMAGFKTDAGALVGGGLRDLVRVYGIWGTAWRVPLLSLLERAPKPDEFLMDGIVVDARARGQGIGGALLAAIKARAADLGKSTIRLDVIDTNPRARALYERQGFVAGEVSHLGPLSTLFGFRSATTMIFTVPPAGKAGTQA